MLDWQLQNPEGAKGHAPQIHDLHGQWQSGHSPVLIKFPDFSLPFQLLVTEALILSKLSEVYRLVTCTPECIWIMEALAVVNILL